MFLAILCIIIGLFLLLNALGIITVANFWGLFWAIIFLAVGVKLLAGKGKCPMCEGMMWGGKFHDKIHGHCCDHDHSHQEEAQN